MFKAIFPRYSVGDRPLLESAHQSAQQGFTMFEVLIALMISFLFLTGTLNAMVMATVMQVRAERQARANYWIKQDLEQVRALAAVYDDISECEDSEVGSHFNANADNTLAGSLASATTTPSEASQAPLLSAYQLYRTPASNGNVSTLSYCVSNNALNCDTNPNNNTSAQEPIATLYTEVLPAAALACE